MSCWFFHTTFPRDADPLLLPPHESEMSIFPDGEPLPMGPLPYRPVYFSEDDPINPSPNYQAFKPSLVLDEHQLENAEDDNLIDTDIRIPPPLLIEALSVKTWRIQASISCNNHSRQIDITLPAFSIREDDNGEIEETGLSNHIDSFSRLCEVLGTRNRSDYENDSGEEFDTTFHHLTSYRFSEFDEFDSGGDTIQQSANFNFSISAMQKFYENTDDERFWGLQFSFSAQISARLFASGDSESDEYFDAGQVSTRDENANDARLTDQKGTILGQPFWTAITSVVPDPDAIGLDYSFVISAEEYYDDF